MKKEDGSSCSLSDPFEGTRGGASRLYSVRQGDLAKRLGSPWRERSRRRRPAAHEFQSDQQKRVRQIHMQDLLLFCQCSSLLACSTCFSSALPPFLRSARHAPSTRGIMFILTASDAARPTFPPRAIEHKIPWPFLRRLVLYIHLLPLLLFSCALV